MDVSKPGKVAADSSARPVIVGHRPMVQDPMVTSPEDDNPEQPAIEEPSIKSPSASKRVISPISEEEKAEEATEAATEESDEDSDQIVAAEESTPDTSHTTDETPDKPTDSEAAVVDTVIDQVDIGSKREAEQKAEEDRKKQEAIDKLVAEKKYFVPIGKTHTQKNTGIMILTVLLLFVLLGLLAAIDAEIIEVGFNLPFDLIK